MRDKKEWDERYEQDDLPWDTGHPDTYLVRMVSRWPKLAANVLEIGCGTGTNSIWLAEHGFQVTGMDISSSAIAIAKERAVERGVNCRFLADDFLSSPVDNAPFTFVFDRGCFHSTAGEAGRAKFVDRMASCLGRDGLWFSLMGNSDEVVEGKGPPRLSAIEIATSVESAFEILKIESCLLEARSLVPPRFWQCLMRVREGCQAEEKG